MLYFLSIKYFQAFERIRSQVSTAATLHLISPHGKQSRSFYFSIHIFQQLELTMREYKGSFPRYIVEYPIAETL